MKGKGLNQHQQQSRSDTNLSKGWLQRAAVREVPGKEVESLQESGLNRSFVNVPVHGVGLPVVQRKFFWRGAYESASREGQELIAHELTHVMQQNGGAVSNQTVMPMQFQVKTDNNYAQQQPIQKKENNTGLPDNLKTGMENLSGMSLDDVKVHRNSDKPAQLQAHAYTQGTDIHLGTGQEKHLPHEAWHVVQQKQARVKPTMQMKGRVNVNDDAGLEKEANVMGAKALQFNSISHSIQPAHNSYFSIPIVQRKWDKTNSDGVEQWDSSISGVRWFKDEFNKMWYLIETPEGEGFSHWEGPNHKYTKKQWNQIKLDVAIPEVQPSLDVLELIKKAELDKSNRMNIGSSRPKLIYLFLANGSPTTKKAEARYMVDTGMDKNETQKFLELRKFLIRTPQIFGYHSSGNPIVEFLNNQATITSQLATVDKGVERSLKLDDLTNKFDPNKWLNTLTDINTLIKLKYNSTDFQFMIDKNTGHVYIMDLESGNTPSFTMPNPGLINAKEIIEKKLDI
jgi:hypothetical protein